MIQPFATSDNVGNIVIEMREIATIQNKAFVLHQRPGRVILYSGWYTIALCKKHRDKVFVFGDNTLRFGKGGQAIIRDEPNAIGVATKRKPAMSEDSFFTECEADLDAVLSDLGDVWRLLSGGKDVVIPIRASDAMVSLGLERAELLTRAPMLYKAITSHVIEMTAAHDYFDVAAPEWLDQI